MLARDEKMAALAEVAAEIAACVKCPLHRGRYKTVPGEGDPDAAVMFIGEAPGWHENQQGRPFVGPAGMFLEDLLRSIGLTRRDVWIGNVVKCRPPDNREPEPAEIESCRDYLDRQIAIVDPRVIATLGRFSTAKFFPREKISRIHGQPRRVGNRLVLPMYHPAAALHQGSLRRVVEQDFLKLPSAIAEAQKLASSEPAAEETGPKPVQLSLF